MIKLVYIVGLTAMILAILLGAVVAMLGPETFFGARAETIETLGNALVAIWFVAGIPVWVMAVTHLWRARGEIPSSQFLIWGFFLLAFSLAAAFFYFPRVSSRQ